MQVIIKYDLISPRWGGLLPFNFIFCYRDVKNVCVCGSPSCIVRFDFSNEFLLLRRSYCLFLYLLSDSGSFQPDFRSRESGPACLPACLPAFLAAVLLCPRLYRMDLSCSCDDSCFWLCPEKF